MSFCRAAALLPLDDLYFAGRATLVSRHEDLAVYDRVFATFFGPERPPMLMPPPPRVERRAALVEPASAGNGSEGADAEAVLASPAERLSRKSFSTCTPDELRELATLMARLRLQPPQRRSRRRRPAAAPDLDVRRTVRRALRTGGDPALLARRERQLRPRRVVLLLDVSRSMSAYSRALLVFAHAALRASPRWEAFCFGTRLTRLTRALATTDPDQALRRATEVALDWDGGTRIGASLKTFLDRYGHAGLARGAIAVVCSDGLDTGDPELLAEQMARLSRLAHLVVWLNPLREDPRYEPLARGMAAALPYVDVFAGGHNLASLEELSGELARNL
ncbi:MAG TPA: VWA domain-containing protein [Gaiellaceae bacterium]